MPRHQLTPEERLRGGKASRAKLQTSGKSHRFTKEDCTKGAAAVNYLYRVLGGPEVSRLHVLTPEERRRGGLARQAQRRALKEVFAPYPASARVLAEGDSFDAALLRVGERLGVKEEVKAVLEGPPEGPQTARGMLCGCTSDGPSLACSAEGLWHGDAAPSGLGDGTACPGPGSAHEDAQCVAAEQVPDPFTLSALQRFRLGPKTPFELKRSEREHLDILRQGGWVEGTELISLTEKGRKAIEAVP